VSRWLALLGLSLAAAAAQADTICRLIAVPGIAFGTYDPLSTAPTDTLTNVRVTCERNGGPQIVTLTMRIGPGTNSSSAQTRRMRLVGAGTDYLSYGLYRDVSRSSVWGSSETVDTVSQTLSIPVPNKGTASTDFTIYGRIPASQDVSVGTYADTVAVTLTP
jgi:spore coat protein U-like protein